jgi:glycosyltransferase involved in cell wall biosynthesis
MARVSVLIASYNSSRYVGVAIASVFAQDYDDWEIVLADDASTDDTVRIAEGFGERVRIVKAPANSGRPAAMRALALEQAAGELVAFLDADDAWMPGYLSRLTGLLDGEHERDPRVAVAACDANLLLEDGRHSHRAYSALAGSPTGLTVERLLIANPVYTSALVTHSVLQEAGGIATELRGTDDYDLWLRVLELGYRVVWTPEVLATYRVRSDSLAHDLPSMARALQATYLRALERGRLTPAQARLAKRRLRLQRAVEVWGLLAARRREGEWPIRQALASVPLFVRVSVENLNRVPGAVRELRRRGAPFAEAR